MREFQGKVAFVTGGASGIGFAMANAFAELGVKVMLADIEEKALDMALADLRGRGAEVRGVVCDVAERASVQRAAGETFTAFGNVHIVCNNAGVGLGGQMELIPPGDWEWQLGVKLWGVIHGIQIFLPHMKAHGEGGHIVNTASIVGLIPAPGLGPHIAGEFAVVGLSEALAAELAGTMIGVSVLCPAFVRTRYAESVRNRPSRFGAQSEEEPAARIGAALIRTGIDPNEVARRVVMGIRDGDLYIFTHPEYRAGVEERFHRILSAYDKWVDA